MRRECLRQLAAFVCCAGCLPVIIFIVRYKLGLHIERRKKLNWHGWRTMTMKFFKWKIIQPILLIITRLISAGWKGIACDKILLYKTCRTAECFRLLLFESWIIFCPHIRVEAISHPRQLKNTIIKKIYFWGDKFTAFISLTKSTATHI
jgi:hypothetical protein